MGDIRERLEKGVAVLEELEQRRRDTNTPLWCYDTECLIIAQELLELDEDILRNPGALESQLVRIRRRIPPEHPAGQ